MDRLVSKDPTRSFIAEIWKKNQVNEIEVMFKGEVPALGL